MGKDCDFATKYVKQNKETAVIFDNTGKKLALLSSFSEMAIKKAIKKYSKSY